MIHPLAPLAGAAAGLIAGSFLGLVAARWPRGEQVLLGRSHCDDCGRALGPSELIPLVSYMVQRGRCRHCGAPISPSAPLFEVLAAVVGALVFAIAETPLAFTWLMFGWALLLLAALDLSHFWLPDRLTLPLAAAGLMVGAAKGALLLSLIGAAVGWAALVILGAMYRGARGREGLGGGDPKLLAAIGAWLGPGALPVVLLIGAVSGLVAAGILKLRGHEIGSGTALPFGVFLVVGAAGFLCVTALSGAVSFAIPTP